MLKSHQMLYEIIQTLDWMLIFVSREASEPSKGASGSDSRKSRMIRGQ
jgi:hypothetical protein